MSLCLLLCAASACAKTPRPFDVVLVVLDACRADKIGAYGFERATTPALDALAGDPDAVIFRRHYAQGTWTKPSTASLFSGLYVHQHGVTLAHQPIARAKGRFRTDALPSGVATLAERLHDGGFTTVATVHNPHLLPETGFAQGFDHWISARQVSGDDRSFLKPFVERIAATRGRLFAYAHFIGCHYPFPPDKRDADYLARYATPYDETARRAAGIDFTTAGEQARRAVKGAHDELLPADSAFLHLLYESRLRWTDRNVFAPFIESLRANDRFDGSLVIVTADHGEELFEHGGYSHGHALWEEVLHIPLIVKFPKGTRPTAFPREVKSPTRAIDLLPSILALAGLPRDEQLPGREIFGGETPDSAFAEMDNGREWTLIRGERKLVATPKGLRLFDLAADPRETNDLASEDSTGAAAMERLGRELIEANRRTPAAVVETDLAPAEIERLKSLGYLQHGE